MVSKIHIAVKVNTITNQADTKQQIQKLYLQLFNK